ncbi:uncharacterized protein YaiI (UPF0178 family) [Lysobacter sp. OAE881]
MPTTDAPMSESEITHPQVWVDADACPGVIKDILFRAAERAQVQVTLVANQWIRCPSSRFIRSLQVQGGFDVADSEIVERMQAGDLVVTQDIPLAARVIEKGGVAVNPRGERYSPENMAERLSMRNFMEELRGAGVQTGGPPAFHARDRQAFANQLDRWLAQRPKPRGTAPG